MYLIIGSLQLRSFTARQALHGRLARDIRNVRVLPDDVAVDMAHPLPDDGFRGFAGQRMRYGGMSERVLVTRKLQPLRTRFR